MRVAVVVPVYNSPQWTRRCLAELLRASAHPDSFHIEVVNDASPEAAVADLEAEFAGRPGLNWSTNPVNRGFLGTCNWAFETLRSCYDYVFLCNSDVLVTPDAIQRGVALFDRRQDVALVSYLATEGAQLSLKLPAGVDYADMHEYLKQVGWEKAIRAVTSVGHLIGIRVASILPGESLFDPSFGKGYGEESDLHYRLLTRGFAAQVVSDAFVYHRGEGSFGVVAERSHVKEFFRRWGDCHEKALQVEVKDDSLAWLRKANLQTIIYSHRKRLLKLSRKNFDNRVRAGARVIWALLDTVYVNEHFDDVCASLLGMRESGTELVAVLTDRRTLFRQLPVRTLSLEYEDKAVTLDFLSQSVLHNSQVVKVGHDGEWERAPWLLAKLPPRESWRSLMVARSHKALQRHVVVFSPEYQLSGGIYVIRDFVHALMATGYRVTVVTPVGMKHPANSNWGCEVLSLAYCRQSPQPVCDLLVVTWWESLFWASCYPAERVLWLVQSLEELFFPPACVHQRVVAQIPYLLRGVAIVTMTPWIAAQLSVRYGIHAELIWNQLPPDCAHLHRQRQWNRAGPEEFSVVVEGSFVAYKNVREAMAVSDSLGFARKTLVFSGPAEAAELAQLRERGWNLVSNVGRHEVLELLREHDILIRTSLLDSFGFSIAEMMATGGLVAVKPFQGAVEFCSHAHTALLFLTADDLRCEFAKNRETQGVYFAEISQRGQMGIQRFIGSAETQYAAFVSKLLQEPGNRESMRTLQVVCSLLGSSLADDRGVVRDVLSRYEGGRVGYVKPMHRPLRHRIADFLVYRIVHALFPAWVYTAGRAFALRCIHGLAAIKAR